MRPESGSGLACSSGSRPLYPGDRQRSPQAQQGEGLAPSSLTWLSQHCRLGWLLVGAPDALPRGPLHRAAPDTAASLPAREREEGRRQSLCSLVMELTAHRFCQRRFMTSELPSSAHTQGKRITQGHGPQKREGPLGLVEETGAPKQHGL